MNLLAHWPFAWHFLSAARKAARSGAWSVAEKNYALYLKARPANAAAWVQYGHIHKALGDLGSARGAYERALRLCPDAPETLIHLADVQRRQGERAAAIDSCAKAIAIDPEFTPAINELLSLGGRDKLTGSFSRHEVADPIDQPPWLEELADRQGGDVYAPSKYDEYRRRLTILTAPAKPRLETGIHVVINARGMLPVDIRVTIASLRESTEQNWTATVLADESACRHPVASIAAIDSRITFSAEVEPAIDARFALITRAGIVLDREAVSWFSFVAASTGCSLAYSDHDRCVDDWRTGRNYFSPMFQPMLDPEWFMVPDVAPALILIDTTRLPLDLTGNFHGLIGGRPEIVVHIPQLLCSIREMTPQAREALPDNVSPPAAIMVPDPVSIALEEESIHVVVQTRDEPALLRDAIRSIRRYARRRENLKITIVDNRSVLPKTMRLLERYAAAGIAQVLTFDEPFNWSRANNLAVADEGSGTLLFLNNDTSMLTPGWDVELQRILADPDVAAVGALLSYPDGTIQHAGMIFGVGSGGPMHEGVGQPVDRPGPGGRWQRARGAAAVTGAFLAVRRAAFDSVGGFDTEHLAIAFNDVDLCLALRSRGFRVVQTGTIRLIHYESKSRGLNVTQGQVAWDLEELAVVHKRWGPALFEDPFYNPHWTRTGQPFDGYRFPALGEVLDHIIRSAVKNPWAVCRPNSTTVTEES